MITIAVEVCGDIWVNPDDVQEQLNTAPADAPISLDFRAEGPSIVALGIVDMLDKYCADTGRNPSTIYITNNPNNQEHTHYYNNTPGRSHFFKMSKNYWAEPEPILYDAKLLGYFMGRRTISRGRILYDLYHSTDSLLSCMETVGYDLWTHPSRGRTLEQIADWFTPEEFVRFLAWFDSRPIGSIDGHSVRDQYVANPRTNSDILKYYNQFQIELVAETYTLGNTFFPTEKTVRPIMANKPFIVYGPKNFLQRLTALGFKTYSTCWDESYDQLEGPERWQAINKMLPQVEYSEQADAIAQHNRQRLAELIK